MSWIKAITPCVQDVKEPGRIPGSAQI